MIDFSLLNDVINVSSGGVVYKSFKQSDSHTSDFNSDSGEAIITLDGQPFVALLTNLTIGGTTVTDQADFQSKISLILNNAESTERTIAEYFDSGLTPGFPSRAGDTIHNLLDTYTNEPVTFTKVQGVTDSDVDGIMIIKKGTEYFKRTNTERINVKWFGAIGNGSVDDTVAIQRAFDYTIGTVYFPQGSYKVTSQGAYCLLLSKNVNIVSDKTRTAEIRADFCGAETSIIKVAVDFNGGLGDVRDLSFRDITISHNGGGKHALEIDYGMPLTNLWLDNCMIFEGTNPNGYGVYCKNLTFGGIYRGTYSSVFFDGVADGIRVEYANFMGQKVGLQLNIEYGSYSHIVANNVFTNRDGAIHIINGSQIKIENNQIEHGLYNGSRNLSVPATSVYIEGRDYAAINNIIEKNNFGGGTNLDYSIVLDNAEKNIINENYFKATTIVEIVLNVASKNNRVYADNYSEGTISSPRPDGIEITDYGTNNFAIKDGRSLTTKDISNFNNLGKYGVGVAEAAETLEVGNRGENSNKIRINGITGTPGTVVGSIPFVNNLSTGFLIAEIEARLGTTYLNDGYFQFKMGYAGDFALIKFFQDGSIETTSPTGGGTAAPFKIGSKADATVALDTTKYIEIEINGVAYKLGIVN